MRNSHNKLLFSLLDFLATRNFLEKSFKREHTWYFLDNVTLDAYRVMKRLFE